MIRETNPESADSGLYILVAKLNSKTIIHPGRLKTVCLEHGYYFYIGKSKRGLRSRLSRHIRQYKKKHWHVDYLLERASIREIWVRHSDRDECRTADNLLKSVPGACIPVLGFGASDCRCRGHLVHSRETDVNLPGLRSDLGMKRVYPDEL